MIRCEVQKLWIYFSVFRNYVDAHLHISTAIEHTEVMEFKQLIDDLSTTHLRFIDDLSTTYRRRKFLETKQCIFKGNIC